MGVLGYGYKGLLSVIERKNGVKCNDYVNFY